MKEGFPIYCTYIRRKKKSPKVPKIAQLVGGRAEALSPPTPLAHFTHPIPPPSSGVAWLSDLQPRLSPKTPRVVPAFALALW